MSNEIRVLFVDDDEDEWVILQGLLKNIKQQAYKVDWIPTFEKAIEKIPTLDGSYDICLIDYRLGGFTGLDLIKNIRQVNAHIPIIIFTGQGDSQIDREVMKAGAYDYLVKGSIDANALERSIRYSINQSIIQKQLIDQEKNLRESEKFAITGRIALVIAHEIRNPLTNVKLALHQLRDEVPFDETALELFTIAERNSDRINDLIVDLLQSTKFGQLKPEDVTINEVVDETLVLAQDRIGLKNIKIEKRFDDGLCPVFVDREKVKIALLNIIVNAAEAMEKDKGVLTLTTKSKNDKCVVVISDNGKGISPENLNSIFEPYFSVKENGIGLGLTTAQTIIYNHNGTINVDSQVGVGTTFTISFDFSPSTKK